MPKAVFQIYQFPFRFQWLYLFGNAKALHNSTLIDIASTESANFTKLLKHINTHHFQNCQTSLGSERGLQKHKKTNRKLLCLPHCLSKQCWKEIWKACPQVSQINYLWKMNRSDNTNPKHFVRRTPFQLAIFLRLSAVYSNKPGIPTWEWERIPLTRSGLVPWKETGRDHKSGRENLCTRLGKVNPNPTHPRGMM